MDSIFVWILMFAGAAVALLGVFLIASERELKVKRREIEALLAKLEDTPQGAVSTESNQPDVDHAELAELRAQNRNLQNEINTLASELDQSRRAAAELREAQQAGVGSQLENQQLRAANDRLNDEVDELRRRFSALEAGVSQGREQEALGEMQAEVDGLRRALNESHARICDLESVRQNLPDIDSIEATHRQERETLEAHIDQLVQEVATARESLVEMQTLRNRLTEAENQQRSLQDEIRHHEEEIPRWQARLAAGEESRRRLAVLNAPFKALLSTQAALAERQRQLQQELDAFAQLIGDTADAPEHLQGTSPVSSSAEELRSSQPATGIADGTAALRAADNASGEPASGPSSAPRGRRYGIFGALVLIPAMLIGFQLLVADSEPKRPNTAKNPERTASQQLAQSGITEKPQISAFAASSAAAPPAAQNAPVRRENPAPATVESAKPAEHALMGTYRVVRATRVYAAPSEISRSLGDIEPGINVNVVDARNGWLEIHSKHGRPPGFIRREAAARVTGRN